MKVEEWEKIILRLNNEYVYIIGLDHRLSLKKHCTRSLNHFQKGRILVSSLIGTWGL